MVFNFASDIISIFLAVLNKVLVKEYITLSDLTWEVTNINGPIDIVNFTGCGMKIRADDPLSMKNFIASVQSRVNELKTSSGEGQGNISSKRVSFICPLSQ